VLGAAKVIQNVHQKLETNVGKQNLDIEFNITACGVEQGLILSGLCSAAATCQSFSIEDTTASNMSRDHINSDHLRLEGSSKSRQCQDSQLNNHATRYTPGP
jgi:hypothetical protein